MPYRLLADAVLILHAGVVLFIVGGLVAVLAGNLWHWRWVNGRGFRLAHLAAVVFVIAQSWLGQLCPLTTLESWLRVQAGGTAYAQGFIEYWLRTLIFYEAPLAAFVVVYTAFGALVLWSWWRFPPRCGRDE